MIAQLSQLFPPALYRWLRRLKRDVLQSGSTGLDGLDLKLIHAIQPRRHGFFVELGANDGVCQSNTYKLQRSYGWSGLLIEPSPARFVECVENRSFEPVPAFKCAACVPFDFCERFVEIEYSDLMSVAKGLNVGDADASAHAESGREHWKGSDQRYIFGALAMPLTEILAEVEAPADFDLLCLDVEGNELAVLEGLDFSCYRPRWILVELRGFEVRDYLLSHGFVEEMVLSANDQYSDVLFRSVFVGGLRLE